MDIDAFINVLFPPGASREIVLGNLDRLLKATRDSGYPPMPIALRNSYSITYTLPEEVLSEIFMLVKAASRVVWNSSDNPYARFKSWNRVTHVCKYWRMVALGCTELWHEIDAYVPPDAVQEFLVRSKERCLVFKFQAGGMGLLGRDIDASPWWYEDPHLLTPVLLYNALRIERMHLTLNRKARTQLLPLLPQIPAPQLKEFSIVGPANFILPANMFHHITPQLEILRVKGFYFNPQTSFFVNNLTTFKLSVDELPMGALTTLLEAFREMRGLQHLALNSISTSTQNTPVSDDFGVVLLPQLRSLSLEGCSLSNDLRFLSHLRFPSQTAFKFISYQSSKYEDGSDSLIPVPLLAFLQVHNRSRHSLAEPGVWRMMMRRTVVEGATEPEAIRFVALGDEDIENALDFDPYESSKLWGYLDVLLYGSNCDKFVCDQDLTKEIASLDFPNLTAFSASCDIGTASWDLLLNRFPNLQEITCCHRAVKSLLVTLGKSKPGSSPALEILHLYKTDPMMFGSALIQALQTRWDLGYPIKEFWYTRCADLDEDFLSHLESLVMVAYSDECDLMESWESEDGDWDISDYDYDDGDEMEEEEDMGIAG